MNEPILKLCFERNKNCNCGNIKTNNYCVLEDMWVLTFEIPGLKLVKVEVTDEVEVDLPGSHFLREIVTN